MKNSILNGIKIYEEGIIDDDEFFQKTSDLKLNLERITLDSEKVKLLQTFTGQALKELIESLQEGLINTYTQILRVKDGILINATGYDEEEDEEVVEEWFLAC
ncbi:hypothetical protein ACSW9O_15495 (plasmid) [Clostridium perfringens]|nr:hypothetical protein [Clostridium perfringens]